MSTVSTSWWDDRRGLTKTESRLLVRTLDQVIASAQSDGQTAVAVAWDGQIKGVLVVADAIKPTSRVAIERFRQIGLRPILLTGDNRQTAQAVAADVGMDASDVIADVLPDGKVDAVRALQDESRVVAMVGDGVNDAGALAQADLGIAMASGTDAAIEASDLTLVDGDLCAVVDAIELSRKTLGTIKANLFWAFAYNVAAIPLAMAGLLNPLIAAAAMALSSVFVVTNSLRLRRFSPSRRVVNSGDHALDRLDFLEQVDAVEVGRTARRAGPLPRIEVIDVGGWTLEE